MKADDEMEITSTVETHAVVGPCLCGLTHAEEVKLVVSVNLQDGDKILLTNQDEAVGNGIRIIRLEMPDAK
jgi:hypothetical protein